MAHVNTAMPFEQQLGRKIMGRLVISRKSLQSFQIGDEVLVTVMEIGRGQVKISINAPDRVKILRSELLGNGYAEKKER